jgi:serine/threonine-protein kinase
MGVVFEAEHVRLRQSVAIKFLRADVLAMPDAIERFEREARTSCRMRGPHVAQVLDVDTDELGRPFMVMELLRGRDLEVELRERGALPAEEAVDWVLQACAAVSEAHQAGVIHRDLKPSNLFLAEEFGTRIVKVLDFGISKIAVDVEPAVTGVAVTIGTPLYMSPEQVRSSRDVDARTDIWSLGVILYELIAGAPPFLGTTTAAIAAIVADATPGLREMVPQVPPELERLIMTALAKSPDDRFPTVEALAAALMPFASPEAASGPFSLRPSQRAFEIANETMARAPVSNRATNAAELLRLPILPTPRPAGPRRRWSVAGALAAVVAVGIGLGAAFSISGTHAQSRALSVPRGPKGPAHPAMEVTRPLNLDLPEAPAGAEFSSAPVPAPVAPCALPSSSTPSLPTAPSARKSSGTPHAGLERPLYL